MFVELITMWYNEEFLAPLFLNHYSWVDKIHIFYDQDTNDRTVDYLGSVNVIPFQFPDKLDDSIKIRTINEYIANMNCDWVIVVDADEFVYSNWDDPRKEIDLIQGLGHNLIYANMRNVYRNKEDKDIDRNELPLFQRRFGNPVPEKNYCKPIIVKPKTHIQYIEGCHKYVNKKHIKPAPIHWEGVHWAMADTCFCIKRRVTDRRLRQSKNNLRTGCGRHNNKITEQMIIDECNKHLNDPRIF